MACVECLFLNESQNLKSPPVSWVNSGSECNTFEVRDKGIMVFVAFPERTKLLPLKHRSDLRC